jgi:hypothetical protein
LLLVPGVHLAARSAARFESPLTLASSDAQLVEAFSWAARQASVYAFDGDAVGPWFEAALPGREAFCMRDVSHQAMGGHALGLQAHVRNVLSRFAENVSFARVVVAPGASARVEVPAGAGRAERMAEPRGTFFRVNPHI